MHARARKGPGRVSLSAACPARGHWTWTSRSFGQSGHHLWLRRARGRKLLPWKSSGCLPNETKDKQQMLLVPTVAVLLCWFNSVYLDERGNRNGPHLLLLGCSSGAQRYRRDDTTRSSKPPSTRRPQRSEG